MMEFIVIRNKTIWYILQLCVVLNRMKIKTATAHTHTQKHSLWLHFHHIPVLAYTHSRASKAKQNRSRRIFSKRTSAPLENKSFKTPRATIFIFVHFSLFFISKFRKIFCGAIRVLSFFHAKFPRNPHSFEMAKSMCCCCCCSFLF